MQNIQDKVEELSVHVIEYINTQYQLAAVKTTEKVANSAVSAITGIIMLFFILIILLIGSVGIAWWIGEQINNIAAGFLLMAAFYLFCLVFIILFRKRILFPLIRNRIIKKIYE